MIRLLWRAITALCDWLGVTDPSEYPMHPSHGWLLPVPATVRARTPAEAERYRRSSGHQRLDK